MAPPQVALSSIAAPHACCPELLCVIHSNNITSLLRPAAAAPMRCIPLLKLLARHRCCVVQATGCKHHPHLQLPATALHAAHLRVPPLVQPRDFLPLAATTTSAPLPLAGLGLNTELVNEPAG
jgi:hypothetical protein